MTSLYLTAIWDALKAVTEADNSMKRVIIESAGIIVGCEDLTVCYDERGRCVRCVWLDTITLLGEFQAFATFVYAAQYWAHLAALQGGGMICRIMC